MAVNRYKYISSKIDKTIVAAPSSVLNSEKRAEMFNKVMRYKSMYDQLYKVRKTAERNIDYSFGKQWGDKIKVADRWITEEENILSQGKVPLKNNMIRQLIKSVVGVFRSNRTTPEAISRDRDEQELGEMITNALQCAHDTNELTELDARMLEMFLMTSIACQMVRYKWIREKGTYDVYIQNINYSRLFFNGNLEDPRGNDIDTIGMIEDLSLDDVIHRFARNDEDKANIKRIYSQVNAEYATIQREGLTDERFKSLDFLTPYDSDKCRVIQAWEIESKERLQIHDQYNGDFFIMDIDKIGEVIKENERRTEEALRNGLSMEVIEQKVLLKYRWFYHQFWTVRYLSPIGDILFEQENPYWHNDNPFILKIYPLVNGEAHSFVEDVIDQQRYINRMITLIDFIMGASAKGVLIFPEDALGDMTKEEVMEEWVKYNGVIFAKVKNGAPLPQQIATNATNIGASEMLAMQMSLLKEISGVSGALQGQQAKSGTPSSLYAQETQNSQTNLLDILESFNQFRRKRDYKMMKVIQQFYDTPRFINIAGKRYSKTSQWYNPERCRNSDFDIVISESNLTPAYRAMMNQFLLQIFQMGQMNVKTLLKASSYPFADGLLDEIEKDERELLAKQQAAAGNLPVSPMGGTPANDLGQPSAAMQQLNGEVNPQTMQLIAQAIKQ